jgi:hypothetical protein
VDPAQLQYAEEDEILRPGCHSLLHDRSGCCEEIHEAPYRQAFSAGALLEETGGSSSQRRTALDATAAEVLLHAPIIR